MKTLKKIFKLTLPAILFLGLSSTSIKAQHSVAREWNEMLLNSIRNDYARPTVHARNLWHTSIVMFDCWSAYESTAKTFFLGDTLGGYYCPFNGVNMPSNIKDAQEEAISYAMYRLLRHRFKNAPGADEILPTIDSFFLSLGYDSSYHSTNYADTPAALGNYIAENIITFGYSDGSNEQNNYGNLYYTPRNPTLIPDGAGNPDIEDPNLWQPLTLEYFIDQSGNLIPTGTPPFLGPEWGNVVPFSLKQENRKEYSRNGHTYWVYEDPGVPPFIDINDTAGTNEAYKWGFSLVATWSSHLDPADSVMWDISPANIGNIPFLPTDIDSYSQFYDYENGGDNGLGHTVNPVTGQPYAPQIVPRGDYARVLAEFWADGPDSETPPGHWFTILNYVNDHPQLEKKWRGKGEILDDLEWDVKAYFALGGAVHDAAMVAWSIKGWYDYIRPISAIRYMADQGQSSDSTLPNYDPMGIPLVPGLIELITMSDPLSLKGNFSQHLNKIKLKAWRGPDYINDPAVDEAGVGWIRAERWWPYQRPTFVTPPFAGFISGHSTFSRTAAEVMTLMTGDAYFPGGMGEFHAPMNEFLVFEEGPSMDLTLQWATYTDASDQCSLSRIWGGIHPPADDIPGRLIGRVLGPSVFRYAEKFMDSNGRPSVVSVTANIDTITDDQVGVSTFTVTVVYDQSMDTSSPPVFDFPDEDPVSSNTLTINPNSCEWINDTTYIARFDVKDKSLYLYDIDVMISGGKDLFSREHQEYLKSDLFNISMGGPIEIVFTDRIKEKGARLNWSTVSSACAYLIRGRIIGSPIFQYFNVPGAWTTFPVTNLSPGTFYEWQIAPNCPANSLDTAGNWTSIVVFKTLDCTIPSTAFSNNITSNSANLNWGEVGDAIGYIVYGHRIGFPVIDIKVPGGENVSYNATGLVSGEAYEWAVEAVCDLSPYINSGITSIDQFVTLGSVGKSISERSGQIVFYPNPMYEESILSFPNREQIPFDLDVFDISGKLIYSVNEIKGEKVGFNRKHFKSGIYFFHLKSLENQFSGKFMVY